MKLCSDCKHEKSRDEFGPSGYINKYGLISLDKRCKICKAIYVKNSRLKRITKQTKNGYRECSRCNKHLLVAEFWRNKLACIECLKQDYQENLEKNKPKQKLARIKRKQNPEYRALLRDKKKEWRKNRTIEQRQKDAEYALKHSRLYAPIRNKRIKERKAIDIGFKISKRLRSSFAMAVRKEYKISSSLDLLGCSIPYFKKYIAMQFTEGQFWWNWGHGKDKWNLDHIIPVAFFDLTNPEEQKKCFHYTNFRPLWHTENMIKSDKLADGTRARNFI